jgi:glycosyltransferase involved in cell wall biosynthesis
MRALLTSFLHPSIVKGGAQRVANDAMAGLRARGVDVTYLGTNDPHVGPSVCKPGAWLTGIEGRPEEYLFHSFAYDFFWHVQRRAEGYKALDQFIQWVRPDAIYAHHFLHFGIDWFERLKRVAPQLRIVLALHEFIAVCAADGQMVTRKERRLCSSAAPVKCAKCIGDRLPDEFSMRRSFFLEALEAVDRFTVPTAFVKERYAEWGLPADKIVVLGNSEPEVPAPRPVRLAYDERRPIVFGFFGQMLETKGIRLLIDALLAMTEEERAGVEVRFFGSGLDLNRQEFQDEFRAAVEQPALSGRVRLEGHYGAEDLDRLLEGVDCVIVPSLWWETFCLVISEAWVRLKPVIVANIGALRERVTHGRDGLLFEAQSAHGLAAALRRMRELLSQGHEWTLPGPVDERANYVDQVMALMA